MPISIETAAFCAQYFSEWKVRSSKPDVFYRVTLNGMSPAHCTCEAFRWSRDNDCKHCRLVWKHACLWNPQWRSECPNDYAQHGIELVALDEKQIVPGVHCPACNGPVIPVKIAV